MFFFLGGKSKIAHIYNSKVQDFMNSRWRRPHRKNRTHQLNCCYIFACIYYLILYTRSLFLKKFVQVCPHHFFFSVSSLVNHQAEKITVVTITIIIIMIMLLKNFDEWWALMVRTSLPRLDLSFLIS